MDEKVKVLEEKMKKAYDYLVSDLATIRAGRANPHVLDKLKVDYYGTPTPIQQVGNVTVPEPRMLQIAPWEKSLIKEIEKAILTSDIGITPTNDGSVIRLIFPELTAAWNYKVTERLDAGLTGRIYIPISGNGLDTMMISVGARLIF